MTADLGTSKTALCVTSVSDGNAQIVYYGESPSDGIRYNRVFNPTRAAEALGKAIEKAQNELDININQLVIGLPRYGVRQEVAEAEVQRSEPMSCIELEEVEEIKNIALDTYPLKDSSREEIYGAVPQSFTAGELFHQSEEDIVGSPAESLTGNFKVFIGSKRAVTNIDIMLNKLKIAPARKLFVPQMLGEAVLTDEEKDNGVALIEMGAGVTSVSIYKGRILRYYAALPFGAGNVTADIKSECGFKESLAENIKLGFGACIPEKIPSLGEKTLQINNDETGTYEHLSIKYLAEIIDCRVREILEGVLFLVQESGYADKLRNGIVLTGGGADLANISNLMKDMSGYNVRTGYPRSRFISTSGCPGISETSAAATVAMLLAVKDDGRLNCAYTAEEAAEKAAEEADAGADAGTVGGAYMEQDFTDTVFASRTEQQQNASARKKDSKAKVEGKKKEKEQTAKQKTTIWKKVGEGLTSLFDDMTEENENQEEQL